MQSVLVMSLAIFALGSSMPPDLKPKCGCPFSDKKVCAETPDGHFRLFDGSCQAGCAGAKIVQDNRCYGTGLIVPDIPEQLPIICGCPPINDPVCAKRADGSLHDFFNRCESGCAHAVVQHSGKCAVNIPLPVPSFRLCGCKPVDEPVCTVIPGGQPKTYPNQCEAGCHDAVIMHEGACE